MDLLGSDFRNNSRQRAPRVAVIFLTLLSHVAPAAPASQPPVSAEVSNLVSSLPDHPRLLLSRQGVSDLKVRIAAAPWARASWEALRRSAEESLSRPVELPLRGGNWSHNYVCPEHGARLTQGRKIGPWEWEHICPVGHHALRGDPGKASLDFDGNAIAGIHAGYAQQIVDDGLLYQVSREARYAVRAREILLAYADRYLSYPLHDNQGRPGAGGHVASQSLTEASWLIPYTQGADLVWNTLSPSDRQAVTEKVLRPALTEIVLRHRLGLHNIQCRHNSAIGLVGLLLGDPKLVAIALDDPRNGFREQLEHGVRPDGMWLEGASGYHFFTIDGLWPLAEAARNCGLNLYDSKFRSMFDGPLALAMPNLELPNFNDSGTVPLPRQSDLYELAYARFTNSAYATLLHQSERRGRLAMLYGSIHVPSVSAAVSSHSHNSQASGYAILQQGRGADATWLCLKYGPHGGGHGHPDKNTFILYARGEIIATDAGTHAYGSRLHQDWDKTTFAHNTLVVDEASQKPATGECLAFGTDRGIDYAITDAGPIYPGVKFRRTAALLDPTLVLFVDQVECDSAHTLDLAYHQAGKWAATNSAFKSSGVALSAPGYRRLTQVSSQTLPAGTLALGTETASGLPVCICVLANETTEIITGYGILKTTADPAPALVQRRRTRSTAFVWAVALDGQPVKLAVVGLQDESGHPVPQAKAIAVKLEAGPRRWSLLINPLRLKLNSPGPGAPRETDSVFAVQSNP